MNETREQRMARLASQWGVERDPTEYKCSECRHYMPEGVMAHPIDGHAGILKHLPARCRRTDLVRGDGWHATACENERWGGCGESAFFWEPATGEQQ